jgi:hypothetical protein
MVPAPFSRHQRISVARNIREGMPHRAAALRLDHAGHCEKRSYWIPRIHAPCNAL